MALNPAHIKNFETMRQASRNSDLALVECTRKSDGAIVAAIAVANRNKDGSVEFMPVATMLEDPFNELNPPDGTEVLARAPD